MDHIEALQQMVDAGKIPKDLSPVILDFFHSYENAIKENGYSVGQVRPLLLQFLNLVAEQIETPYPFEVYHQKILSPTNYYRFGMDILRPLIDFSHSKVYGLEHVASMEKTLAKGENVILLANHQTEPDPQAISLLMEKTHPRFAEEIIFVAGHRVTTDPLAVPFSKGRNLLCIYSKRHIENPPDLKQQKLAHNQRTLKKMAQLLDEGGHCIYVAPSGGRDRKDQDGTIRVAPFDPQSVEMFRLIADHAAKPVRFHPLALFTYDLLPPPVSIEKSLGEKRDAHCTPIHLAFGPAIDMDNFPGNDHPDKTQKRVNRADYIWNLVNNAYTSLIT